MRVAERVEVIECSVIDSVWALRTSWYEGGLHPRLDDWWWRRLDSFAADCDDPRIIALLERMRDNCRLDEQPFECPTVADPPPTEFGIVERILANDRPWQEGHLWHRSNDSAGRHDPTCSGAAGEDPLSSDRLRRFGGIGNRLVVADELDAAVIVLHERRAALDPVAAVVVGELARAA